MANTNKLAQAGQEALATLDKERDPARRAQASRALYDQVADLGVQVARRYRQAVLAMRQQPGATNVSVATQLNISLHRLHLLLDKARREQAGVGSADANAAGPKGAVTPPL
jgi:hypothetical protein